MKRRNTIDCASSDIWPICQYYYTHNNGSCDDILLHHRAIVKRVQRKQSQRQLIRKKSQADSIYCKRHTYPMRERMIDQNKDSLRDFNARQVHMIRRRWSTIRRHKQKRQTLADIITALSRTDSKATALGCSTSRINSNNNHSKITAISTTRQSVFESKWASIRQYNPQLDNEKIEQEFDQEFGHYSLDKEYSHTTPILESQPTNDSNTAADMTSTLLNIETSHQFLLNSSAGQSTKTRNHGDDNDTIFVAIPIEEEASTYSASSSSLSPTNSPFLRSMEGRKQQQKEAYNSSSDMLLFLFGFLFFPLWWFGTWRYFMQQDKSLISKQRLSFQVLNCCMTLASLLMAGLMIGLVTVWA